MVRKLGCFKVYQPTYALSGKSELHILPGMTVVDNNMTWYLLTRFDHSSTDGLLVTFGRNRYSLVKVHMAPASLPFDWRSI